MSTWGFVDQQKGKENSITYFVLTFHLPNFVTALRGEEVNTHLTCIIAGHIDADKFTLRAKHFTIDRMDVFFSSIMYFASLRFHMADGDGRLLLLLPYPSAIAAIA